MSEMTLEEARDRLEALAGQYRIDVEDTDALRVILAALPAPEKRTPGRTFQDMMFDILGAESYEWGTLGPRIKDALERSTLAVLREHGPDFVLPPATLREIHIWYCNAHHLGENGPENIMRIVKARLANG
jgi:hypothetical protein